MVTDEEGSGRTRQRYSDGDGDGDGDGDPAARETLDGSERPIRACDPAV